MTVAAVKPAAPRRRLRPTPGLIAGLTVMAALLLLALVAPWIWGDEAEALGGTPYLPSSSEHWFGTDPQGRDVLARTLVATRTTLLMCFGATAIAAVGGIGLGAAIWVAGPRVREIGQRLIDVMISYPAVLLAMIVAAVLSPGAVTSVVAIGLATCPAFARLTTNLAANIAARDFVSTARLLGVPPLRLLRRHIVPNIAEPLLVLVSVAFTVSLKALSGLSFLGIGVQIPSYDWGKLLADGLQDIYNNPAPVIGPSVAIVLAGLAGGLIGDGLAAALSPNEGGGRARGDRAKVKAALGALDASAAAGAVAVADDLVVSLPDGTRLVDGVSLSIAPGEIVGVVGESGSGKSLTAMSLAKLLPEPLRSDAAQLRVGDLDLTGNPSRSRLATEIGIVYQDPSSSFNPVLKLGGQLTETLRVHGGVGRGEARRRAVEQLKLAHVTHPEARMKQYPHELSGGQRQRAMIASAMLTKPKLLIADEPTTALDVTVQAEVLKLLLEANERDGTAILLISHDIAVVSSVCDRVLVMYSGRLVEELTAGQLRAKDAQHPYTRALLAATPAVDEDTEPASIPGRPPQPADRPAGCAFAPRCALVRPVCHEERPLLRITGTGSRAACHVVGEPAEAGAPAAVEAGAPAAVHETSDVPAGPVLPEQGAAQDAEETAR
ncbi:dipeptide/oligopeptide/nickel ABC transporter permease/ATP-binding protein [Streptomyces indicus]|uniref:Oligopeptide/dipeptide ABC transporter, ATP-binding protein, C-terminal domain-containing protein n=1 Tax=Streptomyces indicus TaxID=417292 RepID=A0A1G8YGH9_9ACTN|nr:dipeptide/oligopeptide/nickel ABC transporter permease/ATP-binding protein [Streptomyces indicus]SDK02029.1 oligopeptide/dipeptide ABC transporter, ATP-binding protein, C-terminal domain-containing protein [Streptomyces indicus]